MTSEMTAMNVADKRLCDFISDSPDAEDVLDSAGVDYWFGWEREFQAACRAAEVDPDKVAVRLASCGAQKGSDTLPQMDLLDLIHHTEEHWAGQLAPSIGKALAAVERAGNGSLRKVSHLLLSLQALFVSHMIRTRSILPVAHSLASGSSATISPDILHTLRRQHLDLDAIAGMIRAEADRMAVETRYAEVVSDLRIVVRETHRHLKIGYNFILPKLHELTRAPIADFEPW